MYEVTDYLYSLSRAQGALVRKVAVLAGHGRRGVVQRGRQVHPAAVPDAPGRVEGRARPREDGRKRALKDETC